MSQMGVSMLTVFLLPALSFSIASSGHISLCFFFSGALRVSSVLPSEAHGASCAQRDAKDTLAAGEPKRDPSFRGELGPTFD